MTISEDQSAGSKIEERNLFVLRNRTPELATQKPDRFLYYAPGLQDYQMQLMLLEQQNKTKLLKARMEADSISNSAERAAANTEAEKLVLTGEPSLANKRREVNDHSVKAGLFNVLGEADTSTLDLQALQNHIELLQGKVQQLEAVQKEQIPSRYQVLHRLMEKKKVQSRNRPVIEYRPSLPFFDHPEWVGGEKNLRYVKCNLPLNNFDLYLEKNKDISFIVYRNFDPSLHPTAAKSATNDTTPNTESEHLPTPIGETIRAVAEDLIEVVQTILESRVEYAKLLGEYRLSHELPAPYLFIYHSSKNLEDIQKRLSPSAQKQLSLLLNYVRERYGHEYAAADSLLSQNMISQEYVQYLFKPGDVLVSHIDGQYMGYVATSWPKTSFTKTQKLSRMGASVFEIDNRVGQVASARLPGDKVTVHDWSISVWYWDFDGNFQRQVSTLHLEVPAEEDEGTNATDVKGKHNVETKGNKNSIEPKGKNIAELNVFPIQYASAEIVDKLRRRGKTFWKCRERRFVSYQENEPQGIQSAVSDSIARQL